MATTLTVLERPKDRRPSPSPGSWVDVVDDRWTVARVRTALTSHINGLFLDSALLADAMLADDRIGADVRTRVLAVAGLPFRLEPSHKGDQRRAKAVAREADEAWPTIAPQPLVGDLARWSLLMGFAPATCAWRTSARRWTPTASLFHPQHVDHDDVAEALRASTKVGLVPITPGDGTWVLHAPSGSRPWMTGLVRALALPWLARQYARRDWSRHSEKHGLPIVGAVVPQEADAADKDGFYSDLRRLGSEGLVMLPRDREGRGFDVKYLEPGNVAASDGFKALLAHCDQAIAVSVLGQANNATEGGSYAKAQALDAIRQDLLEADAAALAETLYRQVLRPWAWFNFGDADLAPWPVWDATPPADTAALASTHKTAGEAIVVWTQAAAAQGLAVDVEALALTYGVPLKRAPETLPPPPQHGAPAPDGGDEEEPDGDDAEDSDEGDTEPPEGDDVALVAGVDLRPPQGVREACAHGVALPPLDGAEGLRVRLRAGQRARRDPGEDAARGSGLPRSRRGTRARRVARCGSAQPKRRHGAVALRARARADPRSRSAASRGAQPALGGRRRATGHLRGHRAPARPHGHRGRSHAAGAGPHALWPHHWHRGRQRSALRCADDDG